MFPYCFLGPYSTWCFSLQAKLEILSDFIKEDAIPKSINLSTCGPDILGWYVVLTQILEGLRSPCKKPTE
jgi:hypothetical protein